MQASLFLQPGQVFLHSSTAIFSPSKALCGFENTIKHLENWSLWGSLDYNGDSSWILDGMLVQSLITIHDGSYMKEVSPDICSAATMIYSTIVKARRKCTWEECSTSAGSYWGEILGGVMTQLILNAAASACHDKIPPVIVDCDNNGVISHGNHPLCSLLTNQTQANVLRVFKHLVSVQPFCIKHKYMQSHTDNAKKWWERTLKEHVNIKVDSIVKKALKAAHCTGEFFEGTFPNKQIWITMGGKKVTGSLRADLEEFWGHSMVKRVFHEKGIVPVVNFWFSVVHFDSVWWSDTNAPSPATSRRSVHSSPSMFLAGVAATPSSYFGKKTSSINVHSVDVNMRIWKNLTRCKSKAIYSNSTVQSRPSWMSWMMQMLLQVVQYKYNWNLLTSSRPTVDGGLHPPKLKSLANFCWHWQSWLGLFCGRLNPILHHYNQTHAPPVQTLWLCWVTNSLIQLTHKQWLYQKSDMHFVSKGLTAMQHDKLTARIHKLMRTKCTTLLSRHQHFMDTNFLKLGSGPKLKHQVWVSNIEMAICIAKVAKGKFCSQETLSLLHTPPTGPTNQTGGCTNTIPQIITRHATPLTPRSHTRHHCSSKT